jgi:hypothetical protein
MQKIYPKQQINLSRFQGNKKISMQRLEAASSLNLCKLNKSSHTASLCVDSNIKQTHHDGLTRARFIGELLNIELLATMTEVLALFYCWRWECNTLRPHTH